MTRKHHRHQRSKWRSLYVWHRYLGLTAALLMLLIATTGLLLNHTEELMLDERYTTSEPLLNLYGIEISNPSGFPAGHHWISLIDQQLFFDTSRQETSIQILTGAVQLQNIVVVASQTEIHLFTSEGELIEALDEASGIPQSISALGISSTNQVIMRSNKKLYALSEELTEAQSTEHDENIIWSSAEELPSDIQQHISQKALATALPVERVLLDLHSGRLFGSAGVYAFDLFAIIFIFLSISGSTIWFKQHLKYRQHQR